MTAFGIARQLLFTLDAERAHRVGKGALKTVSRVGPLRQSLEARYRYDHPALRVEAFGTSFPNPVGMAAGFDKNAEVTPALKALGFGFVEVGTVTPEPQPGNPRPRLFRLPEDEALINRLGFNSQGAEAVRNRLMEASVPSIPLGVNIGKMNDSDREQAIDDFRTVFNKLAEFPDYVVVNVSCPNTPHEFDEQHPNYLHELFTMLTTENDDEIPLLVKVGPDEDRAGLEALTPLIEEFDIDGVIATNTTTERPGLTSPNQAEWGGLSGPPLEERSNQTIRTLSELIDRPIIGVGGVRDAESAYRKIRAGASLVQLYTGFVYGGPSTTRNINRGLVDLLERDGFGSVEEAVGTSIER